MTTPRTLDEFLRDVRRRLTTLERRLGGGSGYTLPSRLAPSGAQVTNWNSALEPGFYWSGSATNSPSGTTTWGETIGTYFQGFVTVNKSPALGTVRITQEVRESQTDRHPIVYRRYYNGATWTAWSAADSRDSDWMDLSGYLVSGVSGTMIGRRIGPTVDIRAAINGSFPSQTTVTEFASGIPEVWRPVRFNVWGAGYSSGYALNVTMRPAGSMAMTNRTGAAVPSLQFAISYTLGGNA